MSREKCNCGQKNGLICTQCSDTKLVFMLKTQFKINNNLSYNPAFYCRVGANGKNLDKSINVSLSIAWEDYTKYRHYFSGINHIEVYDTIQNQLIKKIYPADINNKIIAGKRSRIEGKKIQERISSQKKATKNQAA